MILMIVPEPAPWVAPMVEAAVVAGSGAGSRDGSAPGAVKLLAPWATRGALPSWLPARLRGFWQRRALSLAGVDAPVTVPGWAVGEGALRAWAGAHADRKLRARLALRALVDRLAARWITAREQPPRVVIAPSCAALRGLAAAAERGSRTFLIEDLPDIRALHADLDAAARAHPGCGFLRRYRAPRPVIVRQEAERVLADYLVVRGHHARQARERAGVDPARVLDAVPAVADARGWPAPARPVDDDGHPRAQRTPARILLAGMAAARHGTVEALAAVAARPHLELLVRPGEGTEPRELLAHPRVVPATDAERRHLHGVGLVLAPTWCEAYLDEVARAAALGIPVVATGRGAGFITPDREIAPGDAQALGAAVDEILGTPHLTRAPASRVDVHELAQRARARLAAAMRA